MTQADRTHAPGILPCTSHLPTLSLPTLSTSHASDVSSLVRATSIAAIKHALYAKGQILDPIAVMVRERTADEATATRTGRRNKPKTARQRRRDKLLGNIEALDEALGRALDVLGASTTMDEHEEQDEALSLPILLLHGPSAMLPRAMFLIHLLAAVPSSSGHREADSQADEEETFVRDKRRKKTQGALERRLVRFLVETGNDEQGEVALGLNRSVAPTKTHVLIRAPASFTCQGWIPRRNFKLDLSCFAAPAPAAEDDEVENTSMELGDDEVPAAASAFLPPKTPLRIAFPTASSSLVHQQQAQDTPSHSRASSRTPSRSSSGMALDTPPSSGSRGTSSQHVLPSTLPPKTPGAAPSLIRQLEYLRHPSRAGSSASATSLDATTDDLELTALAEALSPLKRRSNVGVGTPFRPTMRRGMSGTPSAAAVLAPKTPGRRVLSAPTHAHATCSDRKAVLFGTPASDPIVASDDVDMQESTTEEEQEDEAEVDTEQSPPPPPGSRMFARQSAKPDSLLARCKIPTSGKAGSASIGGRRPSLATSRRTPAAGGFVVECALGREPAPHADEELIWFISTVTL